MSANLLFRAAILLMVSAASGCQCIGQNKRDCGIFHHRCNVEQAEVGYVDVGGIVQSPGRIELPEDPLTLSQALALAGGVRKVESLKSRQRSANVSVDPVSWYNKLVDLQYQKSLLELRRLVDDKHVERYQNEIATIRAMDKEIESLAAEVAAQEELVRFAFSPETILKLRKLARDHGEATARIDVLEEFVEVEDKKELGLKQTVRKSVEEKKRDHSIEFITNLKPGTAARDDSSKALDVGQRQITPFVQVDRRKESKTVSYIFALALASRGVASQWKLERGDVVTVINAEELALERKGLQVGECIVQGAVKNARRIKVTGGDLKRLRSEIQAVAMVEPVWVIQRGSPTGLGVESIIIPDEAVKNGPLGDLPLLPGAIYTYTSILSVPEIAEGFAKRLVGEVVSEETRNGCLKQFKENLQPSDRTKSGFRRFHRQMKGAR